MHLRTESVLAELGRVGRRPCVSIYMPVSHGGNSHHQNVLELKNLARVALNSLRRLYSSADVERVMRPIERINGDSNFWNYQSCGAALFSAPGYFRVVRSVNMFDPVAIVADRFHIKPLIRLFQASDRFYVVAVSLNKARLWSGDQFGLGELKLESPNISISDFAAYSDGDRHMSTVSVGGSSNSGGRRGRAVYHNYDDYGARRKIDISKYFAAVDALVRDKISAGVEQPVILACLSEHQNLYREQSKIIGLLVDGINHNPDSMSVSELKTAAFEVLTPFYSSVTQKLSLEYSEAKERGLASDHLQEIGRALARGRVAKLIVEQECKVPGKFLEEDGLVIFGDLQNPHVNDLLDEFADVALRNSGDVVVLPRDRMPSDTGIAAIYRY